MSFFPTDRVPLTTSIRFLRPYLVGIPASIAAFEINVTDDWGTDAANMGRDTTGCTVGIEAFASPFSC